MLTLRRQRIDLQTSQHASHQCLKFGGTVNGPFTFAHIPQEGSWSVGAIVDTDIPATYNLYVVHTGKEIPSSVTVGQHIVDTVYMHENGNGFAFVVTKSGNQPDFRIELTFNSVVSASTAAVLLNGAILDATGKTTTELTGSVAMASISHPNNTHSVATFTCDEQFFKDHFGVLCISLNKLPLIASVSYTYQG